MWETMRLSKLLSWGITCGKWWFSKVILLLHEREIKEERICGTEWLATQTRGEQGQGQGGGSGGMSTFENHCKSIIHESSDD